MLVFRVVACAVVLCMISQAFAAGSRGWDDVQLPTDERARPLAEVISTSSSSDEAPPDDGERAPVSEEEEEDSEKLHRTASTQCATPSHGKPAVHVEYSLAPGIGSCDLFRPPRG